MPRFLASQRRETCLRAQRGGKGTAEPGPAPHTRAHLRVPRCSLHPHLRMVQECKAQLQSWASGLRKGKERRNKEKEKKKKGIVVVSFLFPRPHVEVG